MDKKKIISASLALGLSTGLAANAMNAGVSSQDLFGLSEISSNIAGNHDHGHDGDHGCHGCHGHDGDHGCHGCHSCGEHTCGH